LNTIVLKGTTAVELTAVAGDASLIASSTFTNTGGTALSIAGTSTTLLQSDNAMTINAGSSLTATAGTLHWNATSTASVTGQTGLTIGATTADAYFNGFKSSTAAQNQIWSASQTFTWSSGVNRDMSFSTAGQLSIAGSQFVRIAAPDVRMTSSTAGQFTTTTGDLLITTPTSDSINFASAGTMTLSSTNKPVTLQSGGRSSTTAGATVQLSTTNGAKLTSQSLAYLHSIGAMTITYKNDFVATSTQLLEQVSGGTMDVTASQSINSAAGRSISITGGTLLFQQQGTTEYLQATSSFGVYLSAPYGTATFESTGGGLTGTGNNELTFTSTSGTISVNSQTTTVSYSAPSVLLSGLLSATVQATTKIDSTASGSASYVGGAVSFSGNGLTLNSGEVSISTAENLPLAVTSSAGALSLIGANTFVSSNNDVRLTGLNSASWEATTGVVSIGATASNAGVVLFSGTTSAVTAVKTLSLTVSDRAFGARDLTITSGADVVQELTGAGGAAAQPTAFAIDSNGATFDNLLGYQVGILLRSNTANDVALVSGANVIVKAALGVAFDTKSGPSTFTSGKSTTLVSTGDDMVFDADGKFLLNTVGTPNVVNTRIAATGSNAPLVVESTGTLNMAGASVAYQSTTGARGIEVLADDGSIQLTSKTSFTNTANNGAILIDSGDDATLASKTTTSITSTGSNVQVQAQSSLSVSNKQVGVNDGITFTSGVIGVSSSLDNDLLLATTAAGKLTTTSTTATIVRSGNDWSLASGAGTSIASSSGVVSIGSAGSVAFSATATTGATSGLSVTSVKDQFWNGRNEIVFDPTTKAAIGDSAARAVIHITAGGETQSTAVEIETDATAKFVSANSLDLSAADRYTHTNQAAGLSATSQGGFSLTSFGTPGSDSDVVVSAGSMVSFTSADIVAVGPSGAVSVTSNGAAGTTFLANANVLVQTARNAQVYAQQATTVLGDSWALQAAQLKVASDNRQVYTAGAVALQSASTSVFQANDAINIKLLASNAGSTDIVFQTLQRDSGITFNARSASSNLVFSAPSGTANLQAGADLNVIGNGGVSIAATTWSATAAQDFVLETSGATSIIATGSITINSNKPQPGSDIIMASGSRINTVSSTATTWTAGINAVTGITQGTNKIQITADENVTFRNTPLLGGTITIGDGVKTTSLHIETGRNSNVRSGVNWAITTAAGRLQFSTDGLPTEEGFGSRWSSTGLLSRVLLQSTTNDVTYEGVAGVQVDSGFVSMTSSNRMELLAQGTSGVRIETTEANNYIQFVGTGTAAHTQLANNGSISWSSSGTEAQTGWISIAANTAQYESALGSINIDARNGGILFGSAAYQFNTNNGPIRFTSTGAALDSDADLGINFEVGTLTATSVGDINVRGASVSLSSIHDTLGSVSVSAGAELQVSAEGDNANGNAIELISRDSTAPLDFVCGSQFIIESNGNTQLIGDRGIDLLAQDQVIISSFTNVTFTSDADPQRQVIAADPFASGIFMSTAGDGATGESINVYSGSDTLLESARNIVARARTSLVFESGGEVLFSAGGPVRIQANAGGSFTTTADTLFSSTRKVAFNSQQLSVTAKQASFVANGQPGQPGSGDLRFTTNHVGDLRVKATNNIFLGTGEPVVVSPNSRLIIPVNGGLACGSANNRALFFNSATNALCFCANGVQVCKPLV
jgi:hypothetical protein